MARSGDSQLRDVRWRRVQVACGALGALLAAAWVTAWIHGTVMSRRDLRSFEAARAHAIEVARLEADAREIDAAPIDTSLWAPARVTGYQESLFEELDAPLAVLRIDRLKIEVPVLVGTDEVTLNRGLGWIDGTAEPGSDGNFAVAGHRDGFFRALKDIELGDDIVVESLNGTHTYVVDDLSVVDPSDVSVLQPRSEPTVTLVTCYPFYFVGSAPQRFIVHASLTGQPGDAGIPNRKKNSKNVE
jgi:sortase A